MRTPHALKICPISGEFSESGLNLILPAGRNERQISDTTGFMRNSNFTDKSVLSMLSHVAEENGLLFLGVTSLDLKDDAARYQTWVDEGRHAGMAWMAKNIEARANPILLLEGAKSALIFGFDYYLGDRWSLGRLESKPKIAQYARLPDYHKFMKRKLGRITHHLQSTLGADHSFRITVDSAPVLERALSAKTGAIFIGKNTCAIHPKRGSFLLLGEIFTTWSDPSLLASAPTKHSPRSAAGGCGTCRRCQVHCPTGALDEDYRIDARKCLSYWTIEHRGEIPTEFWKWIARYMFGCDICQLVCPYNRGLKPSAEASSLQTLEHFNLFEIVTMDQAAYERMFGGTPMTRAKITGLRRNALIAATVRQDQKVLEILEDLATDSDAVIRETAKTAKVFLEKAKNQTSL